MCSIPPQHYLSQSTAINASRSIVCSGLAPQFVDRRSRPVVKVVHECRLPDMATKTQKILEFKHIVAGLRSRIFE